MELEASLDVLQEHVEKEKALVEQGEVFMKLKLFTPLFQLFSVYRWFSRYVIAAMLVDENKRFLISSFCSSTSNCTLQHYYLCP